MERLRLFNATRKSGCGLALQRARVASGAVQLVAATVRSACQVCLNSTFNIFRYMLTVDVNEDRELVGDIRCAVFCNSSKITWECMHM